LLVDVNEKSYDLDTNQMAGSGNAVLRVLASDGFNTTSDTSDAPFNVATKPPEALILSPDEGTTAPPSTPVLLSGQGYDLEDGPLTGEALSWRSDRDGNLGTGGYLVSTDLSPGDHTITLTATDSNGNQSAASINLYVGHRTYLPLITKE